MYSDALVSAVCLRDAFLYHSYTSCQGQFLAVMNYTYSFHYGVNIIGSFSKKYLT